MKGFLEQIPRTLPVTPVMSCSSCAIRFCPHMVLIRWLSQSFHGGTQSVALNCWLLNPTAQTDDGLGHQHDDCRPSSMQQAAPLTGGGFAASGVSENFGGVQHLWMDPPDLRGSEPALSSRSAHTSSHLKDCLSPPSLRLSAMQLLKRTSGSA